MGYVILTIIHFSVSVFLILVILLQTGKGADMGAVFGGSSQTVFGSSGAGGFLTKMTTVGAVVFMFTCLSLAYIQGNTSSGVLRELEQSKPIEAPAAPAAPLPEEWGT
ncbi:preprotein translocase subunit SecG, partial [bacterium]|nr:preprotein translocase subunit SecG [bacterium]